MTDPVKRFNTVLDHAESTIDPVWLQFAVDEILKLREVIRTAAQARKADDIIDALDTLKELTDEWE